MAKLSILPPELTKDQDTQNQQNFVCWQNTVSYSYSALTQRAVDFTDPDTGPVSTASTTYTALNGYSFSASIRNPLTQINLNLCLSGEGYIGLFINNQLIREIYFSHGTNSINLGYSDIEELTVGQNSVSFQWRAVTGTITKQKSANSVQITNFNS